MCKEALQNEKDVISSFLTPELESNKDLYLLDSNSFKKLLKNNSWIPELHSYYFFLYFKNKIISILVNKDKLICDTNKYRKILKNYNDSLNILKKFNLEIKISEEDFKNIKFNSICLAPILRDALLYSTEKEKSLSFLIEIINYFNNPIFQKIKTKEKIGFTLFNNGTNGIIFSPPGSGMSVLATNQMFNNFVLINLADNENIWKMWKNYIISESELFKLLKIESELFIKLQFYNKYIATKMMENNFSKTLKKQEKEIKKIKI